jgi:hypothetical protein
MSELKHHGVLGQKWGVRRFQPYPKGYKGKGNFVGEDGTMYIPKKEFKKNKKELKKNIRSEEKKYNYLKTKYNEGVEKTGKHMLESVKNVKNFDKHYERALIQDTKNKINDAMAKSIYDALSDIREIGEQQYGLKLSDRRTGVDYKYLQSSIFNKKRTDKKMSEILKNEREKVSEQLANVYRKKIESINKQYKNKILPKDKMEEIEELEKRIDYIYY